MTQVRAIPGVGTSLKKLCPGCGQAFETIVYWQKYCSRRCSTRCYRDRNPRPTFKSHVACTGPWKFCPRCGKALVREQADPWEYAQ